MLTLYSGVDRERRRIARQRILLDDDPAPVASDSQNVLHVDLVDPPAAEARAVAQRQLDVAAGEAQPVGDEGPSQLYGNAYGPH